MKKFAIVLALCCASLTGFAQEGSEEVVNETEISTGSDIETPCADEVSPQHEGGCGCGKGKGGN